MDKPLVRCEEKGKVIVTVGNCEFTITDIEAINYILQLSESVMVSHRMKIVDEDEKMK